MRREEVVLEALRAAGARHERMRDAIVSAFDINSDPRWVVRRRDVHEAVRRALEEDTFPARACAEVKAIVRRLGGVPIRVSQRRLFRGVRAKAMSDDAALKLSRQLRTPDAGKPGKDGHAGKGGETESTEALKILSAEGMSGEPAPVRPIDVLRRELNQATLARSERAAEVLRLYQLGWSVRRIALRVEMSAPTVHRLLIRNGVSKAKRSGP